MPDNFLEKEESQDQDKSSNVGQKKDTYVDP
jgi:hypothetical protein